MTFSSLGLSAELLRAVADQGYTVPTPIQAQAIPSILAGDDLMATAQTGTGKTAAFTLPLLQRLGASTPVKGKVRALVLVPTRELAAQVAEAVRTYGRHLPFRCAQVFGGVNITPQIRELRNGAEIVVATPGRLIDHLMRKSVDLSAIETLVLDEADRMLDMGFMPAIERILKQIPRTRQTLLFSATLSDSIRTLARRFLRDPRSIDVARRNAAAEAITHSAYAVDQARKRELLAQLFDTQNWQQVLVFTRTKHGADRLAKQLDKGGIEAIAIHGNKSQNQRMRALADFKQMKVRALVATDVAARGLDIDQLPHVVNFDLPANPEDYVHRIGRTGRAGQSGDAISLVAPEERSQFAAIKRLVKVEIPLTAQNGFESTRAAGTATTHQPAAHREQRRAGGRNEKPRRHDSRRDSNTHQRPHTHQSTARADHRPKAADGNRRSPKEYAVIG
ncbi:MAG TPA: DEAD/DEAH box helicase [Burkholderiales bacterium]